MQAPYQQQAKKGLRRQEKGTRVHKAQEIALMIGNGPEQESGYGNYQLQPQTSSMPHLQHGVGHGQHQMHQMVGQQPLSIASPMGQFYQNNPSHNLPQTTVSGKMFQRGVGLPNQQSQQIGNKTSKTTKGSQVLSLLQQQIKDQQQQNRQYLNAQHGNHPSQIQTVSQKIFYPNPPQGQQTSKSSRSRTQLSQNTQVPVSHNNEPSYQGATGHQHTGSNNILMRHCASATLTRPKRNGANTQTTQATAPTHLQMLRNSGHKTKQPSANNLINSSLMAGNQQQLDNLRANQRGSTKHINRPLTSLQQHMAPPMSVTPQGTYPIPINLNTTTISEHGGFIAMQHQQPGIIRSSRSNNRVPHMQGVLGPASTSITNQQQKFIDSPTKNVRVAGLSSGKKKNSNAPKNNLIRSPPALHLLQSNGLVAPASDSTSRRLNRTPVSSILTVTVLEAKLKVDMSSFLHKMHVYCQVTLQTLGVAEKQAPAPQKRSKSSNAVGIEDQDKAQPVILDSIVKKTQNLPGKEPKWSECFVFELKGASEYLLELSVCSTNYLVSDSCIGRAFLKFDGSHSETGSITNWLSLKSDNGGSVENGEVFVSISKEAIPPKTSHTDQQKNLYKHLVQNTEECTAISGDPDDHNAYLQEEKFQHQLNSNEILNQHRQQLYQHDESEVNSEDEEGNHYNDLGGESEEPDEGLESPVDDIVLEEELYREHQQFLLAYQTQQNNQMLHSNVKQQNQMYLNQHQRKLLQQQAGPTEGETTEGELDEQLQAVNKVNLRDDFDEEEVYQNIEHDQFRMAVVHSGQAIRSKKSRNLAAHQTEKNPNGMSQHHTVTTGNPQSLFKTIQPVNLVYAQARGIQMMQYHTGGFMKQKAAQLEEMSNDEQEDEPSEGEYMPDDGEDLASLPEEETSNQQMDSTTGYEADPHPHYQQHLISLNPNMIMQLQQQNAADELVNLQNDIVEENARLRQEVISIDKIQKKIESQNKQIKHEKSNLKQLQIKLRSKAKRISVQQEQLVYKRQQIEKDSIRVNKQMQKMRRIKQTLDQVLSTCIGLQKSEIFSKLRYEASLTQHSPNVTSQHDTSDDWLLAMQAQEFVTNFDKVRQMLEQVASDTTLQGGATGSGDLNNKSQGGATTIQTTQHQQHNSQSSILTQDALSSNLARRQQPYSTQFQQKAENFHQHQHDNGKSQQFMSDDTSICGDRNLLAGIDQSPARIKVPSQGVKKDGAGGGENTAAYWTHSSIREIHAQGQNIILSTNHRNNESSQTRAMQESHELSTPNLSQQPISSQMIQQQQPQQYKPSLIKENQRQHVYLENLAPLGKLGRAGVNEAMSAKPAQSTVMSPSRTQEQQMGYPQQSRFHTEVEDAHSMNGAQTNQEQEARQLYERHLDVDLGEVGQIIENKKIQFKQGQVFSQNHQQSSLVRSHMTSQLTSMTPEPQNNLISDKRFEERNNLFFTKQVTAKPIFQQDHLQNSEQQNRTQLTGESGMSIFARQQEMYNELIGQMAKELHDIQQIKQNLLILQNGEIQDQLPSKSDSKQDNDSREDGLEHQQMQFLLEQETTSAISQAHQQPSQLEIGADDGDDVDADDKEVEGYIWESMQRNAQRMQQLKSEKGIQDPVELERELLKNFKTNEQMRLLSEDSDGVFLPQSSEPNQDEQKFTQSYIIDTGANKIIHHHQPNQAQHIQAEEEELEFKFDPDFLNKINANMAMNDQIFKQRFAPVAQTNSREQVQINWVGAPQQQELFQHQTVQGEQVIQNDNLAQEEQEERNSEYNQRSFISTEEVATVPDGPSFIMDYSNNNDLRHSQLTGEPTSARPSTGKYIMRRAPEMQEVATNMRCQGQLFNEQQNKRSHSISKGIGGAAPATQASNNYNPALPNTGFMSPKALQQNLLSSRDGQIGSVRLPQTGEDNNFSGGRLLNTVEKMDRTDQSSKSENQAIQRLKMRIALGMNPGKSCQITSSK